MRKALLPALLCPVLLLVVGMVSSAAAAEADGTAGQADQTAQVSSENSTQEQQAGQGAAADGAEESGQGTAAFGTEQAGKAFKLVKLSGKLFCVDETGANVKKTWVQIGKKKYYFSKNGEAATGWKRIDGRKFFFNDKGVLQKNKWVGSKYIGADGAQIRKSDLPLEALRPLLVQKLKNLKGSWSVYVKNLKTDESILINEKAMYAASLIKLFAMGAVLEQVKEGKQDLQAVSSWISPMITVSDNGSFNLIVSRIGKKYVNRWIRQNGYKNTKVIHDVGLDANNTVVRRKAVANRTTASDCGKLLESIYRGKCVSAAFSKQMLGLLKAQTKREKIPAGLSGGVSSANKTGETDEVSHDAAIVFTPNADYILVVMVTDPGNAWNRDRDIAEVSRMVYRFIRGR